MRVSYYFCFPSDANNGKNVLMKALLNLREGRNAVVEFLLEISHRMGDLEPFVNAAYKDVYYKGTVTREGRGETGCVCIPSLYCTALLYFDKSNKPVHYRQRRT